MADSGIQSAVENSSGEIILTIIYVILTAGVAIFVLRKIWSIWRRKKQSQRLIASEQEALLNQGHLQGRSVRSIQNDVQSRRGARSSMTEGQRFKLAFLIGLFLTNFARCTILLFDTFSKTNLSLSEEESRSQTLGFVLMDLPTLGLMTSFSLFIYYMAQLTLQLEMEQLGLFGKFGSGTNSIDFNLRLLMFA